MKRRHFIQTSGLALDFLVGELLDWMENAFPKKWKLNGKTGIFNWE
jgi:hypothetical protein